MRDIYFEPDMGEIFYLSRTVLELAPNYKQHILSSAEVRKVCY
jgi:hypothetical protein